MSATIDQRIVEMRFDNKQFEQNVSTTMSTLEKLKQGLNLSGATKGLEAVDTAARRIDLSPLSNAAETVGLRFNAMYTMADQALRNITNSAMNAGKRIVSAFTIDPIKTGLQEYETQINAVQTILANTESKGSTLEDVNGALDTLNTYADKTIYNFTEMTRNIGTFTAAGVDLDTSVNAIQGIANLAAVSGSSSQQASTAMYQLSQALASGTVKLMDWNSVVNAGMGGQVFQDALKTTSKQMAENAKALKKMSAEQLKAYQIEHGYTDEQIKSMKEYEFNIDKLIEKKGSFRETLQEGWLTADVLTETLSHFTMAAEEGSDAWNEYKKALKDKGYTDEQAEAILKLSNTATDAATKVKTASQLWDTLKETAQSGWTQTWEIILGDFEEAKELFSSIYETLSPILEKSAKARNDLLENTMTSNWDKMLKKINDAGIETSKFEESLRATVKNHGIDVDKMVEKHGSLEKAFKAGAISSDILKEAVAKLEGGLIDLQSIERDLAKGSTGDDVKKIQEALKNLDYDIGKSGADGIFGKNTEKAIKAFQEANGLKITGIVDEETIAALEKASGSAKGLSESVSGLIDNVDKLGGRELLIQSLRNVFDAVLSVVKPIKEAFRDIFPPTTADQLYSVIEAIHNFTEKLTLSETASDNLKRTFKGLFAIIDIVKQAFGAVFKAIAPLFGGLDNLGGGILGVTASIGDWLVALDESIKKSGFFTNAVEAIHKGIEKVKNFLTPVIEGIKEFGSAFSDAFSDAASKAAERLSPLSVIGNAIKTVFVSAGNAIKKVAPFIFSAAKGIGNVLSELMGYISDVFQNTSFDKLFDVANGGIFAAIGVYIAKMFKSGGSIFEGIAGMFDDEDGIVGKFSNILDGASDALGAFQDSLQAETLKKIATAIAILAGSLLVLALIPSDRLTTSLIAITTLFGELMGSMAIFSKIGDIKGITKTAGSIVALSAALLVMSIALKIMSTMSWQEMGVGLISLTVGLGALVGAVNLLPEKKVNAAAKAIKKMSTAILILAVGIKIMSTMSWEEMGVGLISMVVGLGALVGAVNLLPKDTALRAAGMVGLATAMVILGAALKIMATMSWEEIGKSLATLAGSLVILAAAMALMKKALPGALAMMVVAPALVVLAGALQLMSDMSWNEIAKGLVALGGSLLIIAGAMTLMKTALPGAAALVIVTAALALLTPVLMALGSMSLGSIGKSLLMLAGVFTVLGVAALVLKPLIPTIISLSGAITLLGVACLSIGAGAFALGLGLTMIATAGSAAAVALVTIVSSLISLIPYLIEQIGVGIIKLCEVISGSAAAICEALKVIILALVDALVASVPAIVEGVFVLVDSLLATLVEYTPKIVSALFDFLIGVLDAIAAKLPDLIKAGVNILMSFFSGVIEALKSVDPSVLVNGLLAVGLLTAIVAAMAAVALLTPAAMVGVLGMGAVVTELAIVLAAIGALAQIPGLEWLISEGGSFLQTVGTAIGQFVGGIVGGFGQGVSGSLPQIGSDLSSFMEQARGFIDGAKSIDASAMDGVKSLVGVILALTATDILQGLTSWITGGSSLTKFGEELAAFGPNMKVYADSVAGIDAGAVAASATAAQALAEMTKHIPNEGGMVAWFTGENSISKFGSELVTLGMGLRAYSMAIVGFNAEAVIASANAATALADMTSHIPNEGGMVSWFTGENSVAKFGSELVSLGMSLAMYSMAITGFNAEAVIASANAAKALVDMTSKIPNEGGMIAWFAGENSVAKFGNELVMLGNSLAIYSMVITGFNAEAVIASANAAKALVDMTSYIPNEGGLVAWFTGENSISKFGSDLISLGMGLLGFSVAVAGVNIESVTAAANAAKILAQLTSYIPNEGGMVAWFTGESSLAKFGTDLIALGKGLKGFSDEVEGINAENVTAAANAAKALAQMASYVPNGGGIVAWFTGENSVAKFGKKLPELGKGLKGFSDAVEGISPENVTAAANAAKSLAQMAETTPKDTSKLKTFGENLVTFGGKLKSYFEKLSEVSSETISKSGNAIKAAKEAASGLNPGSFTNAAKAIDELVKSIKNMAKVKSSDADGFSSAIKKLAETNVKSMLTAFKNAGSDMKKAGQDLIAKFIDGVENQNGKVNKCGKTAIDKFINGITSQQTKAKNACTRLVSACASALTDSSGKFKSAGKQLVNGFAAGIDANMWKAKARARAMAKAAADAAEDELDINSPSKVFRSIGYSVPEGFALGIDRMGKLVGKSTVNMTATAVENVKSSIARMAGIINSDIDSQPTIRPVLDLSNVKSGAGAISSMFSSPVGVLANAGAINTMMNRRSQNGANDDVVSAIDKLSKKMDNVGSTTYNSIGGITYDDNSAVSEAIKVIVRAAKMGRRT